MKKSLLILSASVLLLCSCSGTERDDNGNQETIRISPPENREDIDGLLTYLQYSHFKYMWAGGCQNSGMARVRYFKDRPEKDKDVITVGASGFGIMGIIVAMERNFISRDEGLKRIEKILGFLEKADRWHGMFPHWLDDRTGKTIPFAGSNGEDDGADILESANLIQGLLCVRQYLSGSGERERKIVARINAIWNDMEWDWFVDDGCILWHWSPTVGFKKHLALKGYNETHIVYLLAASSATHPVDPSVYLTGWSRNGDIINDESRFGIPFIVKHNKGTEQAGPMFWTAFSYSGFSPEGWVDPLGIDWWEVLRNHCRIQYNYCVSNPLGRSIYSEDCWGMSSGYTSNLSTDYQALCTSNDQGVITVDAALLAMPYTPEESIRAAVHYYWDLPGLIGPWGFWDAYSETEGTIYKYLANNQCVVVPMIENYRSGLIWELFMSCPEIQKGLLRIGFNKK